jgi:hypothetical protein
MRHRHLLVATLVVATVLATQPVDAQLALGIHASHATKGSESGAITFGDGAKGALGFGAKAGISPILLPVDVFLVGDYFFPDCASADCSYRSASLEVNLKLPLPVVRPYATAGYTVRDFKVELDGVVTSDAEERGFTGGVGVDVSFAVRAFGEVRREFFGQGADGDQWVARVGLIF